MQPLHAAHLFTDTLSQQIAHPAQREAVRQVRGALDSTTDLLTGLFDMSRLEARGLVPQLREFPLAEVLEPLASEFRALAGSEARRVGEECVSTFRSRGLAEHRKQKTRHTYLNKT